MTPRGWKRGRKRSSTTARGRGAGGGLAGRSPAGSRITRASTAIGRAPRTTSGFTSTLRTSSRSSARRARPRRIRTRASTSSAGSPRNGSRKRRWVRSWAIMRRPSLVESGAVAKTTSPSPSARIPPSPSITHGPNAGSRTMPATSSRRPRTCSATSSCTSPSSGRRSLSSSPAAARTAAGSARPRRTRSRSVLWRIASPQSFSTTGKPISSAARAAPAPSGTRISRLVGMP